MSFSLYVLLTCSTWAEVTRSLNLQEREAYEINQPEKMRAGAGKGAWLKPVSGTKRGGRAVSEPDCRLWCHSLNLKTSISKNRAQTRRQVICHALCLVHFFTTIPASTPLFHGPLLIWKHVSPITNSRTSGLFCWCLSGQARGQPWDAGGFPWYGAP